MQPCRRLCGSSETLHANEKSIKRPPKRTVSLPLVSHCAHLGDEPVFHVELGPRLLRLVVLVQRADEVCRSPSRMPTGCSCAARQARFLDVYRSRESRAALSSHSRHMKPTLCSSSCLIATTSGMCRVEWPRIQSRPLASLSNIPPGASAWLFAKTVRPSTSSRRQA